MVEDAANKTRTVIFPTLCNVIRLAQYDSVEAAFAGTQQSQVVPITPWMEKRDDGRYVCIPKDAGYTLTEQKSGDRPA